MSMESMNLNFKFWLAGVIAGVVLVTRWRRFGKRAETTSSDKPKASAAIAAGAKADAERLKRFLERATASMPQSTDSTPTSTSA